MLHLIWHKDDSSTSESVENAYVLIKKLDLEGSIAFFLFCMRAGRISGMLQNNYQLFYEFFCEKKIPIVLAITHTLLATNIISMSLVTHALPLIIWKAVKVVLKRYRIQRALASARTLCPFPEYSPLFQNTILIISEDPDGYGSVSEGPDDYCMVSGCRDKYHIPI
jgi:hypothetical protein